MTLEPNQVDAFREKFEETVSRLIDPQLLIPEIIIDACISLKDITWSFHNIIEQMEPFGPENLRPLFIVKRVEDTGYSKIVKEQHIRFSLRQDQAIITGIGFGLADKFHLLQMKKPVDIVFKIDVNEWKDQKNLQLRMIDFRLSE
jgi:single-stranded-DNA-specific exonuclease